MTKLTTLRREAEACSIFSDERGKLAGNCLLLITALEHSIKQRDEATAKWASAMRDPKLNGELCDKHDQELSKILKGEL